MTKFGVGQSVRRVEDLRLITGHGRYTDDVNADGQAYAVLVRAPVAHADIQAIDIEEAEGAPGVIAVFTGTDLDAADANRLPCLIPTKNRDGSNGILPLRPILASGRVRHVGDPVALVVAETREQAKDAAELVAVDYETRPAVVDTASASEPGQPLVHDEVANNLAFDWQQGDEAATDAAFENAARVVELEIVNNRVISNPMEPRSALAVWDEAAGQLTFRVGSQGAWTAQTILAGSVLHLEPEKVRVLTEDVGGGFGTKAFIYPEDGAIAFAARALKRPVKWTGERSETILSDAMGRDHVTRAALAFDADDRIQGMRVETRANLGAYCSLFAPFIPTGAALKVLPGVYDVKTLVYRVKGTLTNTTPVDAYRGAGRPESIYLMERLMDYAARELGVDPIELRRKNFIGPAQMPFKTAAGETYDTGEFAKVMDAALDAADWQGFPARKAEAEKAGRLRGIGLSYYIESTMGSPEENAKITFEDDGTVSVAVGTQSNGQGHETAYAQILNARLGVPFDRIRIVQGDSASLPSGGGTGGSRSLTAEGMAIRDASEMVIERGKHYAGQEFEAAVADIAFDRDEGTFAVVGTDRKITVIDLAAKAKRMAPPDGAAEAGLDVLATAKIDAWTFPNGCHVAEVEIDPETGMTRIVNYVAVDDFGVVVNPMLVAGQVHGGVVQGIGQALYELAVYDDSGQLVSGSFMDYCMPRADGVPAMQVSTVEVPCKNNPFGIKGCGEAGSVASPAAVINAIIEALSAYGVTRIDMPATPEKVWSLIHAAEPALAAE